MFQTRFLSFKTVRDLLDNTRIWNFKIAYIILIT